MNPNNPMLKRVLHILDTGKRECTQCRVVKTCVRSHQKKNKSWLYRDEQGHYWRGTKCHECEMKKRAPVERKYTTSAKKRYPSQPIFLEQICGFDLSSNPKTARARKSERHVASLLQEIGYSDIRITAGTGPDLTFSKNGRTYCFEVKSASRRKKYNSWCVGKIYNARLNDDYVAIVLPNDNVVVFEMAHHLSLCGRNGCRTITKLVKHSGETEKLSFKLNEVERCA